MEPITASPGAARHSSAHLWAQRRGQGVAGNDRALRDNCSPVTAKLGLSRHAHGESVARRGGSPEAPLIGVRVNDFGEPRDSSFGTTVTSHLK
jgi:hypothetical protein